uniref:Uncharacterized protein n=1 Tax=Labrus bergylta TaxID=56723 RepID=A0A3Q3FJZ7_9LABR
MPCSAAALKPGYFVLGLVWTPPAQPTALPTATSQPKALPTATSQPTALPTATSQPTALPTATSQPTALPTATSQPKALPTATSQPKAPPTATSQPKAPPTATSQPKAPPTATSQPKAPPTATSQPKAPPTANSQHKALPTATSQPKRHSVDTTKLLLLYDENILDNDPHRESKDVAFAQSYLNRVREALQDLPGQAGEFVSLLSEFEQAGEGQELIMLFRKLRCILGDRTDLLRDFAAFLHPEQALQCGLVSDTGVTLGNICRICVKAFVHQVR